LQLNNIKYYFQFLNILKTENKDSYPDFIYEKFKDTVVNPNLEIACNHAIENIRSKK